MEGQPRQADAAKVREGGRTAGADRKRDLVPKLRGSRRAVRWIVFILTGRDFCRARRLLVHWTGGGVGVTVTGRCRFIYRTTIAMERCGVTLEPR